MDISDFLIIYLAAGAPFGVYQITTLVGTPKATAILNVAFHICLWPVYTVLILKDRVFSKNQHEEAAQDHMIDNLRSEIEQLAFPDGLAAKIFDFREIFDRYVGLSEAANSDISAILLADFFDIGSVENKTLASACVACRNHEKLEFHQTNARNEFVDIISDLASEQPEILAIAIRLVSHVDDQVAVDDLNALAYRPTRPATPSQSSHPAHV